MDIKKKFHHQFFCPREEAMEHVGYEEEYRLYLAVASGNIPLVEKYAKDYMNSDSAGNERNGILSKNPLQNTRYHFVIFTALITRLCVDSGLPREAAYTLSDFYINKMDICQSIPDILHIQGELLLDFTGRMARLEKERIYSLPILRAIDYINNHLQEALTLDSLANFLRLNAAYLSHLFKKETNRSIKEYIMHKKIQAAKNMLLYSEMSYSYIAEYFNFSSQSHFISCFKKVTGLTPGQYRQKHYQAAAMENSSMDTKARESCRPSF